MPLHTYVQGNGDEQPIACQDVDLSRQHFVGEEVEPREYFERDGQRCTDGCEQGDEHQCVDNQPGRSSEVVLPFGDVFEKTYVQGDVSDEQGGEHDASPLVQRIAREAICHYAEEHEQHRSVYAKTERLFGVCFSVSGH